MVKERVPVSVIVPVYNVYEYLDQCIGSIINQTFSDFELLLVNDGSTDGSDRKCMEWANRDGRIRVISKKNEGVATARNCGIQNAEGEYLVFVDADDWVAAEFLEKLYRAVTDHKSAMAECDVYRVDNNTGKKVYRSCSGNMGVLYTLEEHMKYGYTAIWKCMIKKSLFVDNGIVFPNCHSEPRAVYALLLAVSGGITNVCEGLYYYRRFRKGSLTDRPRVNHGDENAVGLLAFDNLLQGFEQCGLYHKYEKLLQEIVKLKLSDLLAAMFYRREKREFTKLAEKYYSYIGRKFPGTANFRYLTFGGYNLNRILWHLNLLHNPYGRFNFSSIISIMKPVTKLLPCTHENKYREIMVRRDIASAFWDILEEVKPEYIFIDFIEERFDILRYADGYITKSDAFEGILKKPDESFLVKRNSGECMELWKRSFKEFTDRIRARMPACKMVLIENYLSEQVGDVNGKEYFHELEEIRSTNNTLRKYYQFAAECGYIPIIRASECRYYYTDKQYEYGAVPSHLNEIVNDEIAKMIEEKIKVS